ncbi:MAG: formylglycine-generating enzyme family protein [Myxococcales bacterium]|nr:formylglycine-generating enzyme family protein [Myxococcales bacterium]MCB9715954.1 formylglycine-generating enzyme family protein [Myxococcales bacterium]
MLLGIVACGAEPAAAPAPEDSAPAAEEAPAELPKVAGKRGPKVTVDRSGPEPVVTAFGIQLNDGEPPPDAWHWHEGDVMLGGGPRMPMVHVPAATFTMGSGPFEEGRDADEVAHEVTLSEYWIGATEVTRGQWRAVMGSDAPDCYSACSDEHPVTRVSWDEAVAFTNTLSLRLGLRECQRQEFGSWVRDPGCDGIRLVTEAEWEHAARAGTTTPYSFGTRDELCANANGSDWWGRSCSDGHSDLAPVKSFPANAWGLYEMHGNAREWIWDWYGSYPTELVVDPMGPSFGSSRCLRGGSYENEDRFLRSAFRDSIDPTVRTGNVGFRVARSAPAR